jgi:hypothetical protein
VYPVKAPAPEATISAPTTLLNASFRVKEPVRLPPPDNVTPDKLKITLAEAGLETATPTARMAPARIRRIIFHTQKDAESVMARRSTMLHHIQNTLDVWNSEQKIDFSRL